MILQVRNIEVLRNTVLYEEHLLIYFFLKDNPPLSPLLCSSLSKQTTRVQGYRWPVSSARNSSLDVGKGIDTFLLFPSTYG
jgi:hypothetical protein